MKEDVKIVTGTASIFANQSLFVSLVNCNLDIGCFVIELSSNVNVSRTGSHGSTGDEASFDELMRIVTHNLTIFARSWLAFVGIDNKVSGSTIWRFIHKAPFHATGESSSTTSTQARFLNFIYFNQKIFVNNTSL